MDIYDFFPPHVAEFTRKYGYKFDNPLIMATIISRSNKSIYEKHKAYAEIIECHPDCSDSDFPEKLKYRPKGGLHNYLNELIKWEKKTISDFISADEFSEFALCQESSKHPNRLLVDECSSFESAQATVEMCNWDLLNTTGVVIVKTSGVSNKSWKHCHTATMNRDGAITAIEVVNFDDNGSLSDDASPYGLNDVYVHIPYAFIFIEDIYKHGLTFEVIQRNKAWFPQHGLLIMNYGEGNKFIQVSEFVLYFEANENYEGTVSFRTTDPFPSDEAIAMLEHRVNEQFGSFAYHDIRREDG